MTDEPETTDSRVPAQAPVATLRPRHGVDDATDHGWHRRSRRRWLVAGQAGLVTVAVVATLTNGHLTRFGLSAVLAIHIVQVVVRRSVHNMAELPAACIDERMETVRNRHFRVAYLMAAVPLVALALAALVAVDLAGVEITSAQTQASTWFVLLVVPYLPTWVVAWSEPTA